MMTGSYWEEIVCARPPLAGLDRCDMLKVFDWIRAHFPVIGSKIDWRRAQCRHVHQRITDDVQLAEVASREVCLRLRPGLEVEHAGDSLSPYGIRFARENAPAIVAALLELPEHHYFLAEDRSWVAVVSTEGDLDIVDLPSGPAYVDGPCRGWNSGGKSRTARTFYRDGLDALLNGLDSRQ